MYQKITWLLLSTLLLAACQQQTQTEGVVSDPTPVVARAAGMTFHESDIDREIRSWSDSLQHIGSDPVARGRVLNVLIRRAILSRQAQEIGLTNDPMVQSKIKQVRDAILIEALEEWQTSQIAPPSEQEIKEYYKKHQADFTIPEQIHARHILVGSEKLAWDILKKLNRHPESFETLAVTHSLDDSNKSRGGDLNWFQRGMMVAEFENAAFALKVGGLSKPVKTQFGWHIIEVLGKRPVHVKSLEESHDEIANILQQQALEQWLDKLTVKANVQILKPEYQLADPAKGLESAQ